MNKNIEQIDSLIEDNFRLKNQLSHIEDTKLAIINILEDYQLEREEKDFIAERFRLSSEVGGIGTWNYTLKDKYFICDKLVLNILGINTRRYYNKVSWKDLEKIIPKNELKKLSNAIRDSIEKEITFSEEITFINNNKQRYIRIKGMYHIVETNPFMFGIVTDITQEIEIDKVKTEFVSLASHQLKTPLTSIRWYAELLSDSLSDDSREFIQEIQKSTGRMINLVNSLLNVSRLELGSFAITPSNFNLRNMIKDLESEFKGIIKDKKIKFIVKIDKKIPEMYIGDEVLIRVIFQNIFSNAIKYTQNKGVIEVSLSIKKEVSFQDKSIRSNNILLSVKDSGIGIPEKQKDKIFTKLFRADNVYDVDTDGTGLGLYLVKSILKEIHGDIWFSSHQNQGTTFYVLFPEKCYIKREGNKTFEKMIY